MCTRLRRDVLHGMYIYICINIFFCIYFRFGSFLRVSVCVPLNMEGKKEQNRLGRKRDDTHNIRRSA